MISENYFLVSENHFQIQKNGLDNKLLISEIRFSDIRNDFLYFRNYYLISEIPIFRNQQMISDIKQNKFSPIRKYFWYQKMPRFSDNKTDFLISENKS